MSLVIQLSIDSFKKRAGNLFSEQYDPVALKRIYNQSDLIKAHAKD